MDVSEIKLRGEMPGDEDAIDLVNCQAFRSMDEGFIIRLMRKYSSTFDARFSITAWFGEKGGKMVGHALFSPARIRFLGKTISALALGPIAVASEYQKKGIGAMMLEYGHDLGRQEGFELVFLNGHPEYYPKFGYKACFGFGKITLSIT